MTLQIPPLVSREDKLHENDIISIPQKASLIEFVANEAGLHRYAF